MLLLLCNADELTVLLRSTPSDVSEQESSALVISEQEQVSIGRFLAASKSLNTQLAYKNDVDHFRFKWGGLLLADVQTILRYLNAFANALKPQTLSRHLTAISKWHTCHDFPDPTKHILVCEALAGIYRISKTNTPIKKAYQECLLPFLELLL